MQSLDVLSGEVDKGIGAVVSTIWGVYLRAGSTELAAKEQLELIEHLEDLEGTLEQRGAGAVALRNRIKLLEREARGEMIEIPQKDGTVVRFPREEGINALLNLMDRLGA